MNQAPNDLIGSAEACQILGNVNRSSLSRWVEAGVIAPATQLPGKNGAMLFNRADVEAFAESRLAKEGAA